MKRSLMVSIGLVLGLTAWLLSGELTGHGERAVQRGPAKAVERRPMKVQVRDSLALEVTRHIVVQGQLEPRRSVELKAETTGTVAEVVVAKGHAVGNGQVLVRLAMDDRLVKQAEAESLVAQRRAELVAQQRLGTKNLSSENARREAQAQLAAAEAALAAARLDVRRTEVRAPFAGVLEERPVERGDLLQQGDVVARVVEVERLLATAQVPQSSVTDLTLGQPVRVLPSGGEAVMGRLTYVASVADSATRSFRIEVEVDHQGGRLAAGMSASLEIPLERVRAHRISSAQLSLGDNGSIGVSAVDAADRVVFLPVRIVRSEIDGVWVAGLPEQIRLITLGQGFVSVGERVRPVLDSTAADGRLAALESGR